MYPYNLMPGDRLLVTKAAVIDNAITHSGTYMGDGLVAHLSPGKGLVTEPIDAFLNGQRLEIVRNGPIAYSLLWERFELFAQNPAYRLLSNNCEHLCSFLETGKRQSPQLQGAVAGFGIGLGTVHTFKVENPWFQIGLVLLTTYLGAQAGAPKVRNGSRSGIVTA